MNQAILPYRRENDIKYSPDTYIHDCSSTPFSPTTLSSHRFRTTSNISPNKLEIRPGIINVDITHPSNLISPPTSQCSAHYIPTITNDTFSKQPTSPIIVQQPWQLSIYEKVLTNMSLHTIPKNQSRSITNPQINTLHNVKLTLKEPNTKQIDASNPTFISDKCSFTYPTTNSSSPSYSSQRHEQNVSIYRQNKNETTTISQTMNHLPHNVKSQHHESPKSRHTSTTHNKTLHNEESILRHNPRLDSTPPTTPSHQSSLKTESATPSQLQS